MADNKFNSDFIIDDVKNSKMRFLYQYWLDIRGARTMPSRADLNPADIVDILPHVSLVDVEYTPCRYKFRLVGTESVKAMGHDVTGKYLDELPLLDRYMKGRYDWLVENKRPYIYSDKLKWSEKSFLDYSTISMPLSRNERDVDIILFGMFYHFPKDKQTEPYPVKQD
jgi:hypothetical protein